MLLNYDKVKPWVEAFKVWTFPLARVWVEGLRMKVQSFIGPRVKGLGFKG